MPLIVVVKSFEFWHRGYERRVYEPAAEPVETDEDCASVSVREGWAVLPGEAKAASAAPENKDAAPERATKSKA